MRKVTLYITHDKSTLYIIMDNQEFIYPYNTDEDYQKVRERMNSYITILIYYELARQLKS